MLSSGGTNWSLKTEVTPCSTTEPNLGLDGPSRSIPDSSFDPPRDERSRKRLAFFSEPLGEAVEKKKWMKWFHSHWRFIILGLKATLSD